MDPTPAPRSLADVSRWLLAEGRFAGSTRELVDRLAAQLLALGVPLWRVALNIGTVHPQIVAVTTHWYRADGFSQETRWPRRWRVTADAEKSPISATLDSGRAWRCRLDGGRRMAPYPILAEFAAAGATDYLCSPMRFSDGSLFTASWATDAAGGFTSRDIRRLKAITERVAPVLEALSLRMVQSNLLETYVGRLTARRVLDEHGIVRGEGRTIESVIWCCDLRGFSALARTAPMERTIATLNAFFETVAEPVEERGGEILKFMGDGLLAIFPVGDGLDDRAASRAAVDAARAAARGMAALNARRRIVREPELRYGLGLHRGCVTYGNIGTVTRLDFTVIGAAVNLAARMQEMSAALGHATLLSEPVADYVAEEVEPLGAHAVRGEDAPVQLFGLKPVA